MVKRITKAHLEKAADLIQEKGLAKRVLEDHRGAMCFRGALNAAVNGGPRDWMGSGVEATIADQLTAAIAVTPMVLERSAQYRVPGSTHPMDLAVDFTNHPDTTQEEVIALLRKTASLMPA